jgi:uncharacterized membrane protein HdeD (DUF308 family)
MKSCPTCNRTYPDDTLAFCLMDGSVLSAPYDPDHGERSRKISGSATEVLPGSERRPVSESSGDEKIPLRSTIKSPAPATHAGVTPAPATMRTPPPERPRAHDVDRPLQRESNPARVSWLFRSALILRGLVGLLFCGRLVGLSVFDFREIGGVLGFYALLSGVLEIFAGVKSWIEQKSGWLFVVNGIFSAVSGVTMFAILGLYGYWTFFYWIALWPVGIGALHILTAVQLRTRLRAGWLLALAGLASIPCGLFFGSVIVFSYFYRFLSFKWVLMLFLLVPGLLIMAFGFATQRKSN